MTTPPPTGAQFVLRRGDAEAVVTEVGAALRAFVVAGRDVVVPFAADTLPLGLHGAVLLPWPNRIRDGRYDHDGQTFQLDLSEPDRHTAIHGLVVHTRWDVVDRDEAAITLRHDLVPRTGYPFPLRSEIRYELAAHDLTVTLVTTNLGGRPAPYGVGFHPWLSPGGHALDDCILTVEAGTWVRADERLLPVAEERIPDRLDFRTPRPLGDTVFDDGFVDVPPGARVVLTDPDGTAVTCVQEEGLAAWQVCTGDGLPGPWARSGLAAEPMSCAADAFRTGRRLVHLAQGESHRARFRLALTS